MLNISSLLVKRLIKENTIEYFNIIFKSFKFFDSGFIINILFIHYKNKQPMSVSNSNEQISKNNFRKKKKILMILFICIYGKHAQLEINIW